MTDRSLGRADRTAAALFVVGAAVFALGQLVLPPAAMRLGGTADFRVAAWGVTPSAAHWSAAHRLARRSADLWTGPGSWAATIIVVVFVALVLRRRAPRWLPATIAALATLWQLAAYLTFSNEVAFIRTPRPGSGLFASLIGCLLLAAAATRPWRRQPTR